jgi:hypothetical protein
MKKSLYSIFTLAFVASFMALSPSVAQAQILQLSPLVHSAPPGGYSFHALAPLPSVMSDRVDVQLMSTTSGTSAGVRPAMNKTEPTTVLELKKKQ